MNTPATSSAISECEMANAILIAMNFYYETSPSADPSIKESLLMAALGNLERATNLVKSEFQNN
ncbi:TPA: hypothetical protein PXP91_004070 [Yersinia enterocolitica]|nr:hypothetical protein [Yersinia enterocolitica]